MSSNGRDEIGSNRVAVKFLLSNGLTGSLIGSGGSAIKELMELSGAKVHVSGAEEVYPGTNERVILVSGSESSVCRAQSLIWQLLSQNSKAVEAGERSETWSPRKALEDFEDEERDDSPVSAKVAIPAAAGGLVLGRGGATIRSMAEESGAKISMTAKEESIFTHERILSISGGKSGCAKCLGMVVCKLAEESELAQFVNRGTKFNNGGYGDRGQGRGGRGQGRGGRGNGRNDNMYDNGSNILDSVSGSTTISLAVPEALVGNILGKNGTVIREINSISGAKVTVSPRGEYIEGTTNRLVTITGPPENAQTAHHFVSQKLQQATSPRVNRNKNRDQDKTNGNEGSDNEGENDDDK
mmetsp:Transcript_22663/g.21894  ORF Transcript_22663/g.21894 Transcript_22663/m.21894 type:complete len:355 (+) Transcript_22663:181-1245(+)|eukprot:CAMPEP_0119039822 /NCGR_PEP_ID=MMETSP1177-20130426/9504_1 /TAXON_ID=2985 /ORGANISM="Ochromonas sp, Strain CCMP1899" /LENGTH=354 /DNA_ID=CAMNT_0007004175 /DNA_START=159 /DNA_END=1223 /DNA_ORIENTATION=-